jgi:signal transduction histidine kinase
MRLRPLTINLAIPALLVGLVCVLAALQYRWLGQVSEAEREQLRRSLDQRAREFADDFDGEISRTYASMQVSRESAAAGDWKDFASSVSRWQASARHPQLVRAIYLATTVPGGEPTLRRYDARSQSFGEAEAWPSRLDPVRLQVRTHAVIPPPGAPLPPGATRILTIALAPIVPDVPALLIPAFGALPDPPIRPPDAFTVVDLDGSYLRTKLIPALVSRHFPDSAADAYRVAVLAGAERVYSRGMPPGESIDAEKADVAVQFFNLRLDIIRDLASAPRMATSAPGNLLFSRSGEKVSVVIEHRTSSSPGGVSSAAAGVAGIQARAFSRGWSLVLRHATGSLDAAVTRARRRNLALSFGILGVLGAGVVLVLANARRSSQLAAQQMEFVATVSHELRTPLAVIRSAAQNLSDGVVSDGDRTRRYGQLIEDEGRRLTEMVEQVLEFARLRGERRVHGDEPVDLRTVLLEVAESCQPLCDAAGVTLDVQAEEDGMPSVSGDAAALRRAVQNLVGNALKHAARGGWIGVTIQAVAARRRPEVRVTVSDRGAGIDPADLPHLFEPFYRGRSAVENQVPGNGLGLSLVKRVAEAHGGTVSVRSSPGQGTSFTLHLPAAPASAMPADERRAAPERA